MSEHIIELGEGETRKFARSAIAEVGWRGVRLKEEVVRCGDCEHYYEADNYHPQGNTMSRCCKYFDVYDDEVAPGGFCAWGKRRGA